MSRPVLMWAGGFEIQVAVSCIHNQKPPTRVGGASRGTPTHGNAYKQQEAPDGNRSRIYL
jgi:hypothetical protein